MDLVKAYTDWVAMSGIHFFIYSFVQSFICSFICSFIRSFICSFVQSFICSFIWSFVHSFILSFMYSFIHSFIHSFKRVQSWCCETNIVLLMLFSCLAASTLDPTRSAVACRVWTGPLASHFQSLNSLRLLHKRRRLPSFSNPSQIDTSDKIQIMWSKFSLCCKMYV